VILTKEQILERRLPTEAIDIGDGMQIMVRALPLHVIQQSQSLTATDYGSDAFLFSHAVVSESGQRLYADADIPMLAQTVESSVIQLVVSAAFRLARIDEGMLERIKKNWKSLGVETPGE
jgi:hypothetical protein